MKEQHILIIDDESQNIELAELILQKEGYALFFATSYAESMRILEQERIDIIVLDLMLPDGNGFDILKNIKEDEHNIHVIVVSALSDEETKVRSLKMGACAYITKPYDIISLKSRVKEVVRETQLAQIDMEVFVSQCFKDIHQTLNAERKKELIQTFLEQTICKVELPKVMAYLTWFSQETNDEFILDSIFPIEGNLEDMNEMNVRCLQSCLNKILIRPYIQHLGIQEEEVFKEAPSYFML